MKRIKGFWVIGLLVLAMALFNLWPANASALTLTVWDGFNSPIIVHDTDTSIPNVLQVSPGSISLTTMLGSWYINEYVTSIPGSSTTPDFLALTSDNTGQGQLKVEVQNNFTNTNPFLDGNVYVKSTLIQSDMSFTTTLSNASDTLSNTMGPYTDFTFTDYGQLVGFQNDPNAPYNVTLDYTLNSEQHHELLDEYSVSVGVAAPEPATLLLLGTGLVGLAGLGARRRT